MLSNSLLAVTALITLGSARVFEMNTHAYSKDAGCAKIENKCDFPVTIHSVGKTIEGPFTLECGDVYSETFRKDPVAGGIAIKVTKHKNDLFKAGKPQTIFAYNLDDNEVYYDLSNVFGCPFEGCKLVEKSDKKSCPKIVFPNGVAPEDDESNVKMCTAKKDVELTLCA